MSENPSLSMPKMKDVGSTNIHAAGYDPEKQVLYIQFKRKPTLADIHDHVRRGDPIPAGMPGPLYRYEGVSPADHEAFLAAESKGTHFATAIKGKFKHAKVE